VSEQRATDPMESLPVICQNCHRAAATHNAEIDLHQLIALCDGCLRRVKKAMASEMTCRHGVSILKFCGACQP